MTQHLHYDGLRADTVRHVAKLMAAADVPAPKSGILHADVAVALSHDAVGASCLRSAS
jgi:hypothetical protein